MAKSFYDILEVPRDADAKQIKARFRQLARERHPDRFHGEEKQRAEEAFQEIAEAFNVLTDPVRRRQHDVELDQPKQATYDPRQAERVYLGRGTRAYKQGNYLEAANNFDRATQASPKSAQAWHHLALASMQEQRWLPKAQEAIERACELAPEKTAYLKLAGKIFAQSGMTSRAKQYYNQALRQGGSDPAIRKALAALGQPAGDGAPNAGASGKDSTSREAGEQGSRDREKPGLFRKLW